MSKVLWINVLLNYPLYLFIKNTIDSSSSNLTLFQRISLNSEQLRILNLFFTEVRCEVQDQFSDQIRADFVDHPRWPGWCKKWLHLELFLLQITWNWYQASPTSCWRQNMKILQLHALWLPSPKAWAHQCINQAFFVPSLCSARRGGAKRESPWELQLEFQDQTE